MNSSLPRTLPPVTAYQHWPVPDTVLSLTAGEQGTYLWRLAQYVTVGDAVPPPRYRLMPDSQDAEVIDGERRGGIGWHRSGIYSYLGEDLRPYPEAILRRWRSVTVRLRGSHPIRTFRTDFELH